MSFASALKLPQLQYSRICIALYQAARTLNIIIHNSAPMESEKDVRTPSPVGSSIKLQPQLPLDQQLAVAHPPLKPFQPHGGPSALLKTDPNTIADPVPDTTETPIQNPAVPQTNSNPHTVFAEVNLNISAPTTVSTSHPTNSTSTTPHMVTPTTGSDGDTPEGPTSGVSQELRTEEATPAVQSREHTPDADPYASDSSHRSFPTDTSDNEDPAPKRHHPMLAVDRATRRTNTPDSDYDPLNPAGVRKERVRKRVAGKVIEKLWAPLNRESYKSFENLCDVSLNKVLERYGPSPAQRAKVLEAQKVLSHHWHSDLNARSFLARLHVTKLPPLKSLHTRIKGAPAQDIDPLSIDLVLHKKAVCETYLLAELKQLESLEQSYRALQVAFDLDSKYLSDFTKTTASLHAHIARDRQQKMEELHLDKATPIAKHSHSSTQPLPLLRGRFSPNDDPDIQRMLQDISQVVDDFKEPVRELLDYCDKLDLIQSKLNARLSPL